MVANLLTTLQSESVRLDSVKLDSLFSQLGASAAEEIVCRAIEELAVRLSVCEKTWAKQSWPDLRKSARSLVAIADQIGMSALAQVALDVTQAIDAEDHVAVDATLFRLIRVGEKSLTVVLDLRDVSV